MTYSRSYSVYSGHFEGVGMKRIIMKLQPDPMWDTATLSDLLRYIRCEIWKSPPGYVFCCHFRAQEYLSRQNREPFISNSENWGDSPFRQKLICCRVWWAKALISRNNGIIIFWLCVGVKTAMKLESWKVWKTVSNGPLGLKTFRTIHQFMRK